MLFVVILELIPFLLRAVPAYRRDIDHPSSIFNKGSPFDGNVYFGEIFKAKVNESFQFILR